LKIVILIDYHSNNRLGFLHGQPVTKIDLLLCKRLAVLFLQESKLRIEIEERLFNHAISCYQNAANSLAQLIKIFPLDDTVRRLMKNKRMMRLIFLRQHI
jgi:hypothetical protein